jgi:hypothetical protein
MFLKEFRRPREFNSYWTHGPGCIYQTDLFSIGGILKYAAVQPSEARRTIYFDKGPWVSACIDMYSRYADA